MNKVILLGRLTRDPDIRYTKGDSPTAVARYSLAVNRRFKKDGEADADFIYCIAFGRNGEFAERYLKKGRQISVVGHIQTGSYTNRNGDKVYTTDIVVEEHYFADTKKETEGTMNEGSGYDPIEDELHDDDLPF